MLTLVEHLKNKGYDLYADRFYTSPALADRPQKCGLTLTGTIMSNWRGLPEQFKGKNKMDIGSTECYSCGDMIALAWRLVDSIMSFLFTLRDQQNPQKQANVIRQYNRYLLGVDKLDQMMCYYSFIHKSVKWWRKVFFWILELTVVNFYIICQHTRNEIKQNSVHLAFRRELIHHLIEPLLTSRLQPLISLELYESVELLQTSIVTILNVCTQASN